MKTVKWILTLVFGILGVVYLIVGGVCGSLMDQPGADGDLRVLSLVFGVLGAVFLLAAILVHLLMNRAQRRRAELVEYGTRATATVVEVRPNYAVRVNRRYPLQVVAQCRHPITGEDMLFRSHNVWTTNLAPGDSVEIAFDQMNEKRYAFVLLREAGA